MEKAWKRERERVLGIGYWVQGLRCMAWMGVNILMKDGLGVDASTLQILLNSANLPMVAKPIYGILSDAIYFRSQHRIPYIAFGAFLQAVSWLALGFLSTSGVSVFTITVYLLLSNLGASIAEVANDAIVAETSKSDAKNSKQSSSGELQSFVSMAASAGGIIGNLLGGFAIDRYPPKTMFLFFSILLSIQFLITVVTRESNLNLPKGPPKAEAGIKKQLSNLFIALKKPEIAYSIAWLAGSNAIIPALTGTMFFYQTEHLKIENSILGISKVFGQVAMLVWSFVYNRHLKSVSPRKLISAIQGMMAVLMVSDVLFVRGIYRRDMGLPDSVYVVIFSGILEVLFFFKVLPFSVLIAQLCPPGCEGSLMAFVMSAVALSLIVSGYLGVALASYVGITGNNFEGLPLALLIQAACTMLPILCSDYIYEEKSKFKSKPKSKPKLKTKPSRKKD